MLLTIYSCSRFSSNHTNKESYKQRQPKSIPFRLIMITRRLTLPDSIFVSQAPPVYIRVVFDRPESVIARLAWIRPRVTLHALHQRISVVPSRGFQRLIEKLSGQNQTAFFRYVKPLCRHVASCEAGSEANVAFLNLPPTTERA